MKPYRVSAARYDDLPRVGSLCEAAQGAYWDVSRPRVEWNTALRDQVAAEVFSAVCRLTRRGPVQAALLTFPKPGADAGGTVEALGIVCDEALTEREKLAAVCSLILYVGPRYVDVGVKRCHGRVAASQAWLLKVFDELHVTLLPAGRRAGAVSSYDVEIDLPTLLPRAAEVLEAL